jgi:hypothetical protein
MTPALLSPEEAFPVSSGRTVERFAISFKCLNTQMGTAQ